MRPPQWCSRGQPKPRKTDFAFAFAACLYKLSRYVSRDVEGLGNRSSLRHQAGQFVGSCQPNPLRQLLNVDAYGEFHVHTIVHHRSSGRWIPDSAAIISNTRPSSAKASSRAGLSA
jgi:hypothetical protein